LAQLHEDEALYVGTLRHVPEASFRYRVSLDKLARPHAVERDVKKGLAAGFTDYLTNFLTLLDMLLK